MAERDSSTLGASPAAPFRIRLAEPGEIDVLVAIDDDATALYAQHGVILQLSEGDAFVAAERARWLASAERARAFLAFDGAGLAVGFAALDVLDGEPYLDQLSVRLGAMGRGVGSRLLEQAIAWAEQQPGGALWLTTYAHLPFNRPYYERRGFAVVPEHDCGPGVRHHLDAQRRALPAPEQRVAMRRPAGGETPQPPAPPPSPGAAAGRAPRGST